MNTAGENNPPRCFCIGDFSKSLREGEGVKRIFLPFSDLLPTDNGRFRLISAISASAGFRFSGITEKRGRLLTPPSRISAAASPGPTDSVCAFRFLYLPRKT